MLLAALTTELITIRDQTMMIIQDEEDDHDGLLPERTKARYPMADIWPDCLQGLLDPSGRKTTG